MKAFARILYVFSCTALWVAGGLAVSLAVNAVPYHKVVDELPTLESGMGRIFFFGHYKSSSIIRNRPTLSINDEELDGPYGQDIFFFVDRPAGEYVIAVDGQPALQFHLGHGEKKYVAMAGGKPRNPEDGFFEPDSLKWIMTLRLMSARHAEAVMRNMRWKKTR